MKHYSSQDMKELVPEFDSVSVAGLFYYYGARIVPQSPMVQLLLTTRIFELEGALKRIRSMCANGTTIGSVAEVAYQAVEALHK